MRLRGYIRIFNSLNIFGRESPKGLTNFNVEASGAKQPLILALDIEQVRNTFHNVTDDRGSKVLGLGVSMSHRDHMADQLMRREIAITLAGYAAILTYPLST